MSQDQITRLENKIDIIADKIASIDTTLAKQSIILDEHVRRTNLLEGKVDPIEKHVHMIQGALKLIGMVAIFIGILEALMKMIGL